MSQPAINARVLRAVARVGARRLSGNRYLSAAWNAAAVSLNSTGKLLRQLGQQVAGVFFLFFATAGAAAALREYKLHAANQAGPEKLWLAAGFSLLFTYFAVSSFARARR